MNRCLEVYAQREKESTNILISEWGEEVALNVINIASHEKLDNMTAGEFIAKHCVACGGDWAQMILSGIKDLSPDTYNAIPNKMGRNCFQAFSNLTTLLFFLGVDTYTE